jgi:dUTP pyrophosphatase
MMASVVVAVRRIRPEQTDLPLPGYMTPGAAGMDLYAAVEAPQTIEPGARALIPTGIALQLPDGFEAQVRPRSGLAWRHGVTLLNAPGTIDSDYRGEVQVILVNLGSAEHVVHRGDRIAQLVVTACVRADLRETASLAPSTRAGGGFGHTG